MSPTPKGASFSWCEGILVLTAALCNSLYSNIIWKFLRFTLIAMGRVCFVIQTSILYCSIVSHLTVKNLPERGLGGAMGTVLHWGV